MLIAAAVLAVLAASFDVVFPFVDVVVEAVDDAIEEVDAADEYDDFEGPCNGAREAEEESGGVGDFVAGVRDGDFASPGLRLASDPSFPPAMPPRLI